MLAAILAALDEPGKVTDLAGYSLWQSTPPVPLDAPWPDEPVSGLADRNAG